MTEQSFIEMANGSAQLEGDTMHRPGVLSTASICLISAVGVIASFCLLVADAFELSPEGTTLERVTSVQREPWYKRWILKKAGDGIRHFSIPVHEEITHRIYDCDADGDYCGQVNIEFAPPAILYGVRWNDDPPFGVLPEQAKNTDCKIQESIRLITQPNCWRQLFRAAEKGASEGKRYDGESGAALISRVHFGDLQFLHSMASADDEKADETLSHIMMWAEFTWRVGTGEYGLGTLLKDVKVDRLNGTIARPDWRVQDLFTYGFSRVRPQIRDVAFGSLLHMVEDSFAKGHTQRDEPTDNEKCANHGAEHQLAPGRIREFHSYNRQNHAEHSRYDGRSMLMAHIANVRPHVITVGRTLRTYYEDHASWETVKPYLSCVFTVERPDVPAGPGDGFEK